MSRIFGERRRVVPLVTYRVPVSDPHPARHGTAPDVPRDLPQPEHRLLPPDPPRAHPWLGLVVAVLSAIAVQLVWWYFVASHDGRALEIAADQGAQYGRTELWRLAEPVLDVVSVPFVVIVLLAAMLMAVLRRRVLLAVQVALLMGGANLTTQLLKHGVYDRPDLGLDDSRLNSLPSGHTTVAASVSFALVLVVPRRVRPVAAVLGAVYTCATGISTMVGGWHRPSDAVAAVFVVLAWAGLVVAVGSWSPRATADANPWLSVATAVLLLTGAVVAGAGAVLALVRSLDRLDGGLDTRGELLTAYGGGALGVVAVTFFAFATLLLIDQGRRRPA